jgi:hypothetical protein
MDRLATGLIQSAVLWMLALGAVSVQAANTPVYKCIDRNLGLVYTDVPCKDGEQLDLRAGDADPAAVARLERERDRLDASAERRIADERYAALQRDLADRYNPIAMAPVPTDAEDYAYSYPIAAYPVHRHPRPRVHHAAATPRFAPNPPYVVPRP